VRWAWLDWGLSGWLTTLQCFDTAGWVIRSIKTVGRRWRRRKTMLNQQYYHYFHVTLHSCELTNTMYCRVVRNRICEETWVRNSVCSWFIFLLASWIYAYKRLHFNGHTLTTNYWHFTLISGSVNLYGMLIFALNSGWLFGWSSHIEKRSREAVLSNY